MLDNLLISSNSIFRKHYLNYFHLILIYYFKMQPIKDKVTYVVCVHDSHCISVLQQSSRGPMRRPS